MAYKKGFFLALLALLSACNQDQETETAELDLRGHWTIDHGFYEACQVNATFTDTQLILTFYSHEEDACLPEFYGIEDDALAIRIDDKQDYFEEDGTLATTLQVSAPDYHTVGTLSLKKTQSGLIGDIVAANDPHNLLEPLLDPLYPMTPLSEDWLQLASGSWGVSCDELGFYYHAGDMCEVFEFTSSTQGAMTSYGGVSTSDSGGEEELQSEREEVTFAVRNIEAFANGTYQLHLVMQADKDTIGTIPLVMTLEEGFMVLEVEDSSDEQPVLQLRPME